MNPKQAKKWREETKRTQEGVARLLGVTRGAYALWEQGRSTMGQPRLAALTILSGQKERVPLRRGVEGVKLAVKAWRSEVRSVTPKIFAIERIIPSMPIKVPSAAQATHEAALKISAAYTKRRPLSTDEFVELHARIVRALV